MQNNFAKSDSLEAAAKKIEDGSALSSCERLRLLSDVQVVFLCSFIHLTLMYICRKSGENGFAQNQSAPGSDSKFQFEVCSSYRPSIRRHET